MRLNGIACFLLVALLFGAVFGWNRLSTQSSQVRLASNAETKVSVFFGTTKAMDVGEMRTNALTSLKAKGYTVPSSASCVVNIKVLGREPGCTVMFFDLEAQRQYLVVFNGQGQVSEVQGGAMRHSAVGPNDPVPKVPEGGVRVKP